MSQKSNIFRNSTFKVLEQLFANPNKIFHIRMLEKLTGLSTTAITSTIKELDNIILVEKTPITTNIRANLDSKEYFLLKRIFNIFLLDYYGIIEKLIKINPDSIVLYGSYARGEDIEESDIDILIISKSEYLPKLTHKHLKRINLTVLPDLSKSSSEFKNAVANGIVLHGYLKVI